MMREEIVAAAAKHAAPASGAAGMVLLGIPLGVLMAAFLGAILSFYFHKSTPQQRVWWIVFGVVAIAFAGAWLSLALPHVELLGIGAQVSKVDASARAGLCALLFQTAWNFGNRFVERKVEAS